MATRESRRVVVTGLGLVTPLGVGVEQNWTNVVNGVSGIGYITRFDTEGFATRIAGEVKGFKPEEFIPKKDLRKMDIFLTYAIAAAQLAVQDASLTIDP